MALDPRADLLLNGTWTDITGKTGDTQGVSVSRGLADETPHTDAASMGCSLKNADGRFASRNPLSPYYPYLIRNTQIRVSVPEGASYLRAEADRNSYAYCNDSAGISITGDFEVQLDVTLGNWRASQMLAAKWFEPMNQRTWKLALNEDGTLAFTVAAGGLGTGVTVTSTVPAPVPPLGRQAIKVTYNQTTGVATFFTAPAALNQVLIGPITTGFVQLGGTASTGLGLVAVNDTSAGLYVSGLNQLGWMSDGPNIHSCFGADAATTKAFFDTPDSFCSGGNPTADPRQDGITATAILNYTVYTQFLADINGTPQTIGANTYNPRTINTGIFQWVRFDIESWAQSDPVEQADPQTYIANFISLAHGHGFKAMVTPGRDLGNTDTAHPKNSGESLNGWYIRTGIATACASADVFEVQDQANQPVPAEFARFFSAAYAQAKAAAPAVPVWCGISTTYGDGPGMYSAAKLAPLADGFWINIIGDTTSSLALMKLLLAGPPPAKIPGMQGKTHSLKLLQGIGGTVKASPDFTAATAGVTSFADAQGNTWKLYGTTEVSNRRYRFHGETAAWPQTWDPSGRAVWANVTANGLLRRLGQRTKPLASPMRRYWTKLAAPFAPVVYWPCENTGGSFSSGLPGGAALGVDGKPSYASDPVFAGSQPLPKANGGTNWVARPAYTPTGITAIRFLLDIDTTIAAKALIANIYSTGVAPIMQLYWDPFLPGLVLGIPSANNSLTITQGATPMACSLEFVETGNYTTTTVKATLLGRTSVLSSTAAAFSGTTGQITQIRFFPSDLTDLVGALGGGFNAFQSPLNTAAGHIALQTAISDFTALAGPQNGFQGEAAGVRFQRLCGEENISFRSEGQLSASSPMGAQSLNTFVSLLEECADADRGLMIEPRQVLALGYRTRYSLSNQTAAIALDYTAAGISDLQPTDDDQYTVNDVTVTRQGGASARQALTAGPMSIQAPPNGVSLYDSQVTLNVAADTQPLDEAGWLLRLGTVNESRYPAIALNLRKPALSGIFYDLQDIDLGDRYTMVNLPVQLPPDGISQIIHQQSEQLSTTVYAASWTGVPESPYQTMLFDDATLGRYDTDGSTLEQPATSTAGQLQVKTASGSNFPLWTTALTAGWSFTVSGTPGDAVHFIVTTGQSASIRVGDIFIDTTNPAQAFRVTAISVPFAGFVNISFTPNAGANMNNPDVVTQSLGDFPLDIVQSGERVTVAKIAAPPGVFLSGDASTFEGGIANWTGAGNDSIAQTAAQAHTGTKSLALTSSAAGNMQAAHCGAASIATQGLACAAGEVVTASAWFRTAVSARSCNIGVEFFDNQGNPTVVRGADITDSAAAWTQATASVTAPASTVSCRANVQVKATGAASEVHYTDDVLLGSNQTQVFNVVRSVNGVVKAQAAGTAVSLFNPPIFAL